MNFLTIFKVKEKCILERIMESQVQEEGQHRKSIYKKPNGRLLSHNPIK